MSYSLTDALQAQRFTVVEVDAASRRIRVRGGEEACTDLACPDALVLTDEGASPDLAALNAGDIVTLDGRDGRVGQIRVVRRVYDELSSPEF
jgi:hypothetical protein